MTVSQLRRELKKKINHLSEPRLRTAADFIGYLEQTSDPIALAMSRRIEKAEREIAQGLVTSTANLRRKY